MSENDYNISNPKRNKHNHLLSEEIEEMINLYINSDLTTVDLSKIYRISQSSVYAHLKRRDIQIRSWNFTSRKPHKAYYKYHCNENYFDSIDTEDKAYFFGLLFADGNISILNTNSMSMRIMLQECDKDILLSFLRCIESNHPLKYDNKQSSKNYGILNVNPQYRIGIQHLHFCKTLISYGMVPKKSFVKQFPEVILNSNEDIIRHFIRGYFDGNGCIYFKYRNDGLIRSAMFSIVSTLDMCNVMRDIIYNKTGVNCKLRKNSKHEYSTIHSITVTSINETYKILCYLYDNSNFYLDRKYKQFMELDNFIKLKVVKHED